MGKMCVFLSWFWYAPAVCTLGNGDTGGFVLRGADWVAGCLVDTVALRPMSAGLDSWRCSKNLAAERDGGVRYSFSWHLCQDRC